MKRVVVRTLALALLVALCASPLRAQEVLVFDPSNYAEAILEVIQLIKQLENMILQATRLPLDMASRYHGHSVAWTFHDLTSGLRYAAGLLQALNEGDPAGAAYQQATDPLDVPTDILGRMPADLQARLTRAYGTIELADSVAKLAIDQTGAMRTEGPHNLQVAKDMEADAVSTRADFQTQTALLDKIDAASTLGLRIQAEIGQSVASALEQAIVANKRQRDTEAVLMNATIYQWRYGPAYGAGLFEHTAADLDSWRLR